jgi:hypothetical protein
MDAHPWDRQPGESDKQYGHFLAYRDLGPARTVGRAYRRATNQGEFTRGQGAKRAPGFFRRLAQRWRWQERAGAWDVRNLQRYGERVAPLYVAMLERLAACGLKAAARHRPGQPEWEQVLATAALLGKLLKPARDAGLMPGCRTCGRRRL